MYRLAWSLQVLYIPERIKQLNFREFLKCGLFDAFFVANFEMQRRMFNLTINLNLTAICYGTVDINYGAARSGG